MMANIWWSLPLTLIVFFAARKLAARYKFPLLNPLLVAMVVIIPFLMLTGISYDSYFKGSEVLNDLLQPAVVALAGPATNFGLFLIGFFFFGFLYSRISFLVENEAAGRTILELFLYLGMYNAFLCIFNLLPIPGLDGWNALTEYVVQLKRLSSEFAKGVTIFLIFLLLFSTGFLFKIAFDLMFLAPELLGAG